jgi:hypothetical protein
MPPALVLRVRICPVEAYEHRGELVIVNRLSWAVPERPLASCGA